MAIQTGDEDPPKSTDLDGWRKAIADNRLKNFWLEALVAAFQDLGPTDQQVQHALAKHLSDSIIGLLRSKVGFNYPNQGEDIIFRVHGDIFAALMLPKSADGRILRLAFGPRVIFRMKDAIAKELRERRTHDDIALDKEKKKQKLNGTSPEALIQVDASAESEESGDGTKKSKEDPEEFEDSRRDDASERAFDLDDGLSDLDERLDVERILDCVSDGRKRLAFYLYMNGVPFKSKQENVESIARALNISERTAREWVKEVRLFLAENNEVKHLRKLKAGEKS